VITYIFTEVCSSPGVPNGHAVNGGAAYFKTGHEVSFSCNEGFSPLQSTTTCQATREWSPPPVCTEITCKVPHLGNGRYTVMSGNRETNEQVLYNTWIRPVCNYGYTPTSIAQRKCGSGGQWSGTNVYCYPITCKSLPDTFYRGKYISSDTTAPFPYDHEVTAVCFQGYHLTQPVTRRCINYNIWSKSDPDPECRRIKCQSPNTFINGQYNGSQPSYDFGTVLVPTCNTGYYMLSNVAKRICEQLDTWSGSDPQCRIVTCKTPNFSNGHYYPLSSYLYNATIIITCTEGYELKGGSATRTCQADGTWGQPPLECVKILCNDTSDVRHEHIDHYPELAIGENGTVSYNSNHIFLSSGYTEVTCATSRKLKWIKAPQFGKLLKTKHVH